MCTALTNPTTHPGSSALCPREQQRVQCHLSQCGSTTHASLTAGLPWTSWPCRQRVGDSTWGDSGSASTDCRRLHKSEFTHKLSTRSCTKASVLPLPSTVMIVTMVTHFRGEFLAQQAERSRRTWERLQHDSSTDRCIPHRLGISVEAYTAQLSSSQADLSPIRYHCFICTNLLIPLNC